MTPPSGIVSQGGFTDSVGFFGDSDPFTLVEAHGSPLYVYNETILRNRCREVMSMMDRPRIRVNFSAKANSNPALLRIVRQEGLCVTALSPGEIHIEMAAGFGPDEILYICNNVSAAEMRFAVERGVRVSVDSLSQLDQYGRVNPGGEVAVRFNPGTGGGHQAKAVTAGADTKFGMQFDDVDEVLEILRRHKLRLAGVNQHIGSPFMTGETYLAAAENLLLTVRELGEPDFVDFGGGFGVPYRKLSGQTRLDLPALGRGLEALIDRFEAETGWAPIYMLEPGRYVCAECGLVLGTVHAVKEVGGTLYAGTDLGFNVLSRPAHLQAHHDIEVFRNAGEPFGPDEPVCVTGNICEKADVIASDRWLPEPMEGDVLAVLDAGAYGYAKSSNYNCRLRPAEVLVLQDGSHALIRRADTLDDLLAPFSETA